MAESGVDRVGANKSNKSPFKSLSLFLHHQLLSDLHQQAGDLFATYSKPISKAPSLALPGFPTDPSSDRRDWHRSKISWVHLFERQLPLRCKLRLKRAIQLLLRDPHIATPLWAFLLRQILWKSTFWFKLMSLCISWPWLCQQRTESTWIWILETQKYVSKRI